MKYQIELKRIKEKDWRHYKVYDYYIVALFTSFIGRHWTNFNLLVKGMNYRIETRIMELKDD